MKILYVSNDRHAAELAGFALGHLASEVDVVWAGDFDDARRCIDGNPNPAALIVEVEPDDPSCASFIGQVRDQGVTAPVIVVSERYPAPPLTGDVGVDVIIAEKRSLSQQLPRLVSRALPTAKPAARPASSSVHVRPLSFVRLYRDGTILEISGAALAALGHSGDTIVIGSSIYGYFPEPHNETVARLIDEALDGTPGGDELEITRSDGARRSVIAKVSALTHGEGLILLVFDAVVDRGDEASEMHETDVDKDTAAREAMESQLADARAHIERLQQELETARRGSEESRTRVETEAGEREQLLQAQLREAIAAAAEAEQRREAGATETTRLAAREQQALQDKLTAAEAALRQAEEQHEADMRAARERLTERQAAFDARLTQAAAARQTLEQRLEDAETAMQQARQDHAAEAAAIAERDFPRESQLTAKLAEATAARQQLEQQVAGLEAALRQADERASTGRQSASQGFARFQRELEATLTREVVQRRILATKLAEAEASHQRAEQLRLADAVAAADKLAQQHAELTTGITTAVRACDDLERRMNDALAAVEQACEGRAADAAAAARHLAQREAELTAQLGSAAAAQKQLEQREAELAAQLASAATTRKQLEQRVADVEAQLQDAERRAGEQQAAQQQMTERQAGIEAELARETANRQSVEHLLAEAKLALHRTEEQRASEARAAAARFAEHQQRYDAAVSEAAAALEQTRQDRAADATSAARLLALREAELASQLANAATTQKRLEQRLADAEMQLQDAERRMADQRAAQEQMIERHAAIEGELARETANRQGIEQLLAAATLSLQRAEEQRASEATAAEARFAEHQQRFDARVSEAAAAQEALEARLVTAEAALQLARQQHASELAAAVAQLTEHQKQSEARLAEATAAADAARERAEQQHASEIAAAVARLAEHQHQAERQLAQAAADAAAALQSAEQQSIAERQAAAEEAAERQTMLEAALGQELSRRQAVEAELDDTRAAADQAQRHFLEEIDAMRQRVGEHEARLEQRAAQERSEWETALADRLERIRHLQQETELARKSLVDSQGQIQRLESAHEDERANVARARTAMEVDLARERADNAKLRQTLDQTQAMAQEALEHLSSDHAAQRARLEALVAERDAQLREVAARKQASDETAAKAIADIEQRLHLALEGRNQDGRAIEQLQKQLKALGEELVATTSLRDGLKLEADRVPLLRKQIDGIRDEHRLRFDGSPISMCRCSRNGAVTQANPALARLLGYRTPEELLKVDFASTVFESGDELQWIVDRCLASRSTESVETTWRRKDGKPIVVRVMAVATTPDSIDLGVEDLTAFRALEEKLRNAQRMEAVARYAAEVAVTCDNLLKDVRQQGHHWLAQIDSQTVRYQGELLFDELTRATRFLQQLAVYGKEQKNVPDLVDVNKVLRDLEPVLKRVAGDNMQLVLPKDSTPLNLDVEAERVERILVNVAAYGRQRMPLGGRLMIEVTSVVVDRKFVEKYPNVRPGAHALLTVTEVKGAASPDWLSAARNQASGAGASASASDRPGLDLGVLQGLVNDCGGHLWLMVEPPGDMVLKIHLPRRVLDDRAPAKRSSRWINRLAGARH